MKYIALTISLLMASFACGAQSLAMPDDDVVAAQNSADADGPAPAETVAERPQARYNTPSKSYKDERTAIRRGNTYFNKGQYHEALENYNKALEVNSGSIRGRYNAAVALLQLQSDDNKGTANDPRVQAGAMLEELIADAKNYDKEIAGKSYYNLGNMAYNEEKYDRAIEMYKSSLRLFPDDLQARENLRLAQLKKQEQENQDQNQDQNQDKQDQQEQQQQQQQQQEQQEQEQQQQQQQQQPMTQSAQQILQSMQNKENQTRKKVNEQEVPAGRPQTDKPW